MQEKGPEDKIVLPLAAEEVSISKREVVKNRATVKVVTDTESGTIRTPLSGQDVEIRHVPVNRQLDSGAARPEVREEDGVTVIPVFEEVLVTEKRVFLKEEIHIIRHAETRVAEIPVTLRTQRIVVERHGAGGARPAAMQQPDRSGGQTMTRTVTAVFDDRADATHAVDRLIAAGITRDAIRVIPETDRVPGEAAGSSSSYDVERDDKGFWATLADMFMPNEDRYSYAEALHRGDIMVTATVDDAMADEAEDILEEYGTVSMDDREQSWRQQGWSGWQGGSDESDTSAAASSGADTSMAGRTAADRATADREGVIPLAEEDVRIGKRVVDRGRVKVRSYVVETPVEESVRLREEQVNLERRPVDRAVGAGEADDLFRERSVEVEERGEEPVVSKTARVREEVAVGKTVEERTETVRDTVRRTEVEVDDQRKDGGTGSRRKSG